MPLFIHHKPLSPSATTSPHKKTSSCQCERHLPEKLSSRNFSSSLKLKGPQHSQDGECNAPSTSTSQCDAREIGNFEHSHRKGQKISIISQGTKPSGCSFIHLAKRSPQSFLQRQIKNRQQLYVTTESEKNKLETDEDKLDNHHDDPDCNKNWYKVVWRELKKQAKRIVSSEADADSSSDESVSFDTRVTERRSDSRKNLHKDILPNENVALPSSEGVEVKIESWDRVKFHKIAPSVKMCMILESNIVYNNPPIPAVSSHVSIPEQNRSSEEKADTLGDGKQNLDAKKQERNILPVEVKKKFLKMSESTHPELSTSEGLKKKFEAVKKIYYVVIDKGSLALFKLLDEIITTSGKTGEKPIENIMGFKSKKAKKDLASLDRNSDEKEDTVADEVENKEVEEEEEADNYQKNEENMATSEELVENIMGFKSKKAKKDLASLVSLTQLKLLYEIATLPTKTREEPIEINILLDDVNRKFINRLRSVHPEDSVAHFKLLDEITTTADKTEEKPEEDRLADFTLLADITTTSDKTGEKPIEINILLDGMNREFINRLRSVHPEVSLTQLKLLYQITTLLTKTGETPIELHEMVTLINERKWFLNNDLSSPLPTVPRLCEKHALGVIKNPMDLKISLTQLKLLYQITTLLTKTGETPIEPKNASAGERSEHESARIRVYRNVIRNETRRMMTSIDMVVSEAERLFGHERAQIFFNLLDDELFHFGSAGAIPGFIPNMTESTVRQHVISFFEHSCDVINRLMALLLGCPDRERLQQMPEQNFMSLMQSVIHSSIQTATKGGKKLSLKENTLIMVDSKEFERALGEEIPEDVLDKLRRGEEMVAHRFVDTKIGRTQASERRENSQICFIYFPLDCQLFIYIPTEKGSYWHRANMQRENRIRQLDK